jgi:hypothetical protein
MNRRGLAIVALGLGVFSGGASASILTFEFDGVLDRVLREATFVGVGEDGWNQYSFAEVGASTWAPGGSVARGQDFRGAFSYDPLTAPSLISDNAEFGVIGTFGGATQALGVVFPDFFIPSIFLPISPNKGSVQVAVNAGAPGHDVFIVRQTFSSADWFASVAVSFTNFSGTLYSEPVIPTHLSLEDFDRSIIEIGIVDRNTQNQLTISGTLTSLRAVQVSEPSTMALFLMGLIVTLLRYARERSDSVLQS